VPTTLLRMSLNSWQDGTEEIVPHQIVKEYIQSTAVKTGVDDVTLYNTRVDSVTKQGHKWHIHTTTLLRDDSPALTAARSWVSSQMACVVDLKLTDDRISTLLWSLQATTMPAKYRRFKVLMPGREHGHRVSSTRRVIALQKAIATR
jgi:hypothetical protein